MKYCLEFSYNGKNYFGYQIQPKQISVQEELEKALSILLREEIKTIGAGRTDTGVHAKKIVAHFETQQEVNEAFCRRLNAFLPSDIAVHKLFPVKDDFHARFSATYRTYEYYISTSKNPFNADLSWSMWRRNLAIDRMNEACSILFEYNDFTSFAKIGSDNKTNLCTIYKAFWQEIEGGMMMTISADRFLRNMVRSIVGTMVDVGTGKINPNDVRRIIEEKNRNAAGTSAPAQGLFLVDVGYDWEKFILL
ncbi:MAG: tRNA pseudouridine(38-40) synthase TruA [Bacteroidetes bacterium]|nr:tRNA pseudouridine(38-40) synthase TruA [Bacteroidota bacterium]